MYGVLAQQAMKGLLMQSHVTWHSTMTEDQAVTCTQLPPQGQDVMPE